MAVIGNLVAEMTLSTAGLIRGFAEAEAIAATGAARVGSLVDALGRPIATSSRTAAAEAGGLGVMLKSVEDNLGAAGKAVSRFHGPLSTLSPAMGDLAGSLKGIVMLTAASGLGFGNLAVLIGALSGALTGSFVTGWRSAGSAMGGAKAAAQDLEAELDDVNKRVGDMTDKLATVNRGIRDMKNAGGNAAFFEIQARAFSGSTGRQAETRETLKGLALLEDPAAGPAGTIAKKLAEDVARGITDAEKAIRAFGTTIAEVSIDSPLQKAMIGIRREADGLIETIPKTAQEFRELSDAVNRIAGVKMQEAVRGFVKLQGPGFAQALGLGDNNAIAGIRAIQDLKDNLDGFKLTIQEMARSGVDARTLFDTITEGQVGLDAKVEALNERFAAQPAILERIRATFSGDLFGGLARNLDDTVRRMQGLAVGTAQFIDTAAGINTVWTPALQTAGAVVSSFTTAMYGVPTAADAAAESLVILTTNAGELAVQLHEAYVWSVLLNAEIGRSANLAPAPLAR